MTISTPTPLPPIVIFGPSGTGKSTLLKRLQATPEWSQFGFSVSHTTRKPRPGEVNGVAYHFVDRPDFERLISEGAFIEHAEFSGNCYGTTIKAVADVADRQGKICILDIDAQGVKLIRANHPSLNPFIIFVSPPSLQSLTDRLSGRGTETAESLAARVGMARSEIEYAATGVADFVVVNDDLDRAYEKFFKACIDRDRTASDTLPPNILASAPIPK
ncbi:hypothetical protein CROQUDRAFT_133134 [Cronartium quercuum f. sp. fusiforme G11]|uniref:Guanylate kinase n=1 Tax=Cronartium quercuum f. sp. fusiforme G11 TaxID=708437 RepID=A0A9P6TC79_9BASI|nr:hypothetical protein CROQUDRAFT_133134 [Cronartium quercuum f. sp. fusiforme G11]